MTLIHCLILFDIVFLIDPLLFLCDLAWTKLEISLRISLHLFCLCRARKMLMCICEANLREKFCTRGLRSGYCFKTKFFETFVFLLWTRCKCALLWLLLQIWNIDQSDLSVFKVSFLQSVYVILRLLFLEDWLEFVFFFDFWVIFLMKFWLSYIRISSSNRCYKYGVRLCNADLSRAEDFPQK